MRRRYGNKAIPLLLLAIAGAAVMADTRVDIPLPAPRLEGPRSLEEVIAARRSIRDFSGVPLTTGEVSQLLWSAQGISDRSGLRTVPSAGALYPLELYLVAGDVEGIEPGVYRYNVERHGLQRVASGDRRGRLARAALWQPAVEKGAAVLVFSGVYERTARKYGGRAERYVHIEVGHAAQNVFLQAVALGLGTVVIGAFHDQSVSGVLELPAGEEPLYIMPIGRQ